MFGKYYMKLQKARNLTPFTPLPYEERGVSKPLSFKERGMEARFLVKFMTFQTSS
jgi:hypothetical protein